MSIILKGLDLPTEDQVIVIHSDGTFNEVDPFARRLMPLYKVIQIPKGHGRLVDADALFQDLREHNIPFNNDINSAINVAPTILEAEEGKEK